MENGSCNDDNKCTQDPLILILNEIGMKIRNLSRIQSENVIKLDKKFEIDLINISDNRKYIIELQTQIKELTSKLDDTYAKIELMNFYCETYFRVKK